MVLVTSGLLGAIVFGAILDETKLFKQLIKLGFVCTGYFFYFILISIVIIFIIIIIIIFIVLLIIIWYYNFQKKKNSN